MPQNHVEPDEPEEDTQSKQGIHWRKNVLLLMALAYGTFVAIFVASICVGENPIAVYNAINIPFVALIGGTLTIAKDII